jgi:hypothetical protein
LGAVTFVGPLLHADALKLAMAGDGCGVPVERGDCHEIETTKTGWRSVNLHFVFIGLG